MSTWSTYVDAELRRAVTMVARDHQQRWVTMDGKIHESPVPYRDAISVFWMPIQRVVAYNHRPRILAHSAVN